MELTGAQPPSRRSARPAHPHPGWLVLENESVLENVLWRLPSAALANCAVAGQALLQSGTQVPLMMLRLGAQLEPHVTQIALLTSLRLDSNRFHCSLAAGCSMCCQLLGQVPQLRALSLALAHLSEAEVVRTLRACSPMQRLTYLALSHSVLFAHAASVLAAWIARLPDLQHLTLAAAPWTRYTTQQLLPVLAQAPQLSALALSGSALPCGGDLQRLLALCGSKPTLRMLDTAGTFCKCVRPQPLVDIAHHCRHLQELHLDPFTYMDGGDRVFPPLPSLRALHIPGNMSGVRPSTSTPIDQTLCARSALTALSGLTALTLGDMGCGEGRACSFLYPLQALTRLVHLDFPVTLDFEELDDDDERQLPPELALTPFAALTHIALAAYVRSRGEVFTVGNMVTQLPGLRSLDLTLMLGYRELVEHQPPANVEYPLEGLSQLAQLTFLRLDIQAYMAFAEPWELVSIPELLGCLTNLRAVGLCSRGSTPFVAPVLEALADGSVTRLHLQDFVDSLAPGVDETCPSSTRGPATLRELTVVVTKGYADRSISILPPSALHLLNAVTKLELNFDNSMFAALVSPGPLRNSREAAVLALRACLKNLRQLLQLKICYARREGDSLFEIGAPFERALVEALTKMTRLTSLELKRVRIGSSRSVSPAPVTALVVEPATHMFQQLTRLKSLRLHAAPLMLGLRALPLLLHLELRNVHAAAHEVHAMLSDMPLLRSLHLAEGNISASPGEGRLAWLQRLTALTVLELDVGLASEDVDDLGRALPCLRDLQLLTLYQVSAALGRNTLLRGLRDLANIVRLGLLVHTGTAFDRLELAHEHFEAAVAAANESLLEHDYMCRSRAYEFSAAWLTYCREL